MTRIVASAVLVLAALGVSGCETAAEDSRPQVVVTTNILGDVVEEVLGDQLAVTTLMQANADPHSFEISAQQAALMDKAELIVANGLGLEENLQQHLDRAEQADVPIFVAGEAIEALPYAAGEAAGSVDPHFWTDPATMIDVVDALEQTAKHIDGINATQLADRAAAYRGKLTQLERAMVTAFADIPPPQRALVTNHHVFGYLAHRFEFRVIGAVIPGGSTLAAPSAADLHDLVAAIEEAGVSTIFAESSQPDRLVQVLAQEASIHVDVVELFTESLTEPGGGAESYLEMMYTNTERIARSLSSAA